MRIDERIGEQEGLDAVVVRPLGPTVFSSPEKKRLVIFTLGSILVHICIFGVLYFLDLKRAEKDAEKWSKIAPSAIRTKMLTLDELQSLSSNVRSVVQSARVNDSAHSVDKKVFLGEQTQRVAKQTRAAQFGNLEGNSKTSSLDSANALDGSNSRMEKNSHKSDVLKKNISSALSREQVNLSRLGVGAWVLPQLSDSEEKIQKKLNHATEAKVSHGSHDLVDRDIALGAETLLNTDEYKYASLFNRIKSEVAPRWEPRIATQLSNPKLPIRSGFYRTETTFVVDASGAVLDVIIDKASGVEGFDAAARGALLSLPIIKNLPKDLAEKDGRYRIQLGFVVNVSQSQLQAEYVPDPRLLKKRESSE